MKERRQVPIRQTLNSWYWRPHICGICSRKEKWYGNSRGGQTLGGLSMCRREVTPGAGSRAPAVTTAERHCFGEPDTCTVKPRQGRVRRAAGSRSTNFAEQSGNVHKAEQGSLKHREGLRFQLPSTQVASRLASYLLMLKLAAKLR